MAMAMAGRKHTTKETTGTTPSFYDIGKAVFGRAGVQTPRPVFLYLFGCGVRRRYGRTAL